MNNYVDINQQDTNKASYLSDFIKITRLIPITVKQ